MIFKLFSIQSINKHKLRQYEQTQSNNKHQLRKYELTQSINKHTLRLNDMHKVRRYDKRIWFGDLDKNRSNYNQPYQIRYSTQLLNALLRSND